MGVCGCSMMGVRYLRQCAQFQESWGDYKIKILVDQHYGGQVGAEFLVTFCDVRKTVSSISLLPRAINKKNDPTRKLICPTGRAANVI